MMQIPFIAIAPFLDFVENAGISKKYVLEFIGVDFDEFESCEGWVSISQYNQLLHVVQQRLQDDLLGVKYGLYLHLQALGIVYQISMASESVSQALIYLKDYLTTTFPVVSISDYTSREIAYIEFIPTDSWKSIQGTSIHHSLIALSLLVYREIRLMLPLNVDSIALQLPEEQSKFTEILTSKNIPYRSNKDYGVYFPANLLNLPLPERINFQLESLIVEYERILEKIKDDHSSWKNRTKNHILHQMGMGSIPKVDDIAFQLNLSRRSFQRKLKNEGYNYREVLEEILRTLSQRMLQHNRLSIQDISYILGYAEPSAFIHAYKRWFDQVPSYSRRLNK